jgi:hypothetical protein
MTTHLPALATAASPADTERPLTCDPCKHAPATILLVMARDAAARATGDSGSIHGYGRTFRLLCRSCAPAHRAILKELSRAATFIELGTEWTGGPSC